MSEQTPTVERVGPESAATVLEIVRAAFAARPTLDPPADASAETEGSLARMLTPHGGLLARVDGEPVGALVLDAVDGVMFLRRFGVVPGAQGHGVASALVEAALAAAEGYDAVAVVAREELPRTVRFWERHGFREVGRTQPLVELRRSRRSAVAKADDGEQMQQLGRRVASLLAPGDLLVLTGGLGAGKTTFTQGLGAGLGVRGGVTSPTFVIARVHPSEVDGPDLVHVDAYRLGGLAELDDLDLDTALEEAVTVVEWGEGLAEGLAESRLEIRIVRDTDAPEGELDPRRVEIDPIGPRWATVDLAPTLAGCLR